MYLTDAILLCSYTIATLYVAICTPLSSLARTGLILLILAEMLWALFTNFTIRISPIKNLEINVNGFLLPTLFSISVLVLVVLEGFPVSILLPLILFATLLSYVNSRIVERSGVMVPLAVHGLTSSALLSLIFKIFKCPIHLLPTIVPTTSIIGLAVVDVFIALRYGNMVLGGAGYKDALFASLPITTSFAILVKLLMTI
ncbi:MAG: hypothetical protein DRO12_05800 [Thermoprotei archaeon]|nr:MAG: hypothetical protein DRO12_05800 [Thermoprotei archaeon]